MAPRHQKKPSFNLKFVLPSTASFFIFLMGFSGGYILEKLNEPQIITSLYDEKKVAVCFSPDGNCVQLILKALSTAKTKILMQSYSFTSPSISDALVQAAKRGVKVRVLCDKIQISSNRSVIPKLRAAGIDVNIDPTRGMAHNKIIILDDKAVITGSYNFTDAANKLNAENIIFIQGPSVAAIYTQNWLKRFASSKR